MDRFKKRICILAEERHGNVAYRRDDSLRVQFDSGSATFTSASYEVMACCIDLGEGPRTLRLPKTSVFDIIDRLAVPIRL